MKTSNRSLTDCCTLYPVAGLSDAPIPRRDLPFGAPDFLGDDSVGRAASPPQRTSVRRPQPDDRHTLIWVAPRKE